MISPTKLNGAQDAVFANQSFWPKEVDGDEVTYCNLATLAVANGVGCQDLNQPETGCEPYTADQLYSLMLKKSGIFFAIAMATCQTVVNAGNLVFAILPSWKLQQAHGHIVTLTTGVGDFSGRWNTFTPFCMNLGRSGTCFRRKGVNWAFQGPPEFFAWGTTS